MEKKKNTGFVKHAKIKHVCTSAKKNEKGILVKEFKAVDKAETTVAIPPSAAKAQNENAKENANVNNVVYLWIELKEESKAAKEEPKK